MQAVVPRLWSAALLLKSMLNMRFKTWVWFCLASSASSGCVVSTYEGTGGTPAVPLPPEPEDTRALEAAPTGPAEISASHILISYRGAMRAAPYIARTKAEAQALAEELAKEAKGGADFAKLSEKHSDDPGSASAGGSLGVFTREQMVREFSDAAFQLEVGQVSDAVESPFGFHVIRRDE